MDRILMQGLRFAGYHGVMPAEKKNAQVFEVDAALSLDLSAAGQTDQLHHTVDYSVMYTLVKELVEERQFNLIETLAEEIAAALLERSQVREVVVRVKKLRPPIPGDYDGFAVEIMRRKWVTAYIGMGSNLGDRARLMQDARAMLAAMRDTRNWRFSSVYETSPWGKTDQPDFLNQAAVCETVLSPLDLLAACQQIEAVLGRVRAEERWGPRTMDLDILLYGDQIIREPDLIVPHPFMTTREFVMKPLLEINPNIEIPVIEK